nr:hypothetical protein [Tanacetum cinerariifolium]
MAPKLMEQKSQAKDERILENNQKQGNVRAMVTAPTDDKVSSGSLSLYERCFTRHVGPCTFKCHKCGKVGHKARIMPTKSTPLTQAAIHRMIKESVDAAITAERARHANDGNDARGSGPVRGQDVTPVVHECTFVGFMKCNPNAFHGTEGAVKLRFKKTESVFGIS